MLPTFSQNLTLQEAFETAAQMNEELKRMEFDGTFRRNLAFRRNSVEKMIHQKKEGQRTWKIVKSKQSCRNGHLPYYCLFCYLAPASMHAWRVNLRAQQRCLGTISANVLKQIRTATVTRKPQNKRLNE